MKAFASLVACGILAAMPVRAAVTCSGSNVSIPFGAYDVLNASPTDTQGEFLVTCTRDGGPANTLLTVSIGPSAASGTVSTRQMVRSGGAERLGYNLYRDAARVNVWGQTVGLDTVSRTLNVPNKASATASIPIYARIPAQQDLRIGTYADSLVITVSY